MIFKYNALTGNLDLVDGVDITVPQTGWMTPTNYTTDKSFDASATSITELANVLATLIVTLKTAGILDDFSAGEAMGVLGLSYS